MGIIVKTPLSSASLRPLARPPLQVLQLYILVRITPRDWRPIAHSCGYRQRSAAGLDIRRLSKGRSTRRCAFNVIVGNIAQPADTSPVCPVRTARAPRPTSSHGDRQVIESEAEDGSEDADEETKENVEAVVAEVEPAGSCDENGQAKGRHGDDEKVDGRSGRLAT